MKSKHLLLALASTLSVFAAAAPARAASFTDVNIDFDEATFTSQFTNNETLTDGTAYGFNALDDSSATPTALTTLPAPAGDAGDDFTITVSTSGTGGNRSSSPSGPTPRSTWNTTSTGRFTSYQSFINDPGSGGQSNLISTSWELDFASHLKITDLTVTTNSINTAGVTWEYAAIEFLDTSGNVIGGSAAFNQATDIGDYATFDAANSGGIQGQLRTGIFLAASTGTVTPSPDGTAKAEAGSSGTFDSNNTDITAAMAGVTAGTEIGGARLTVFQQDVRGTANANSNFSASFNDITISGEVVPEPFTILGSIAALGFGGVLRKKLKGEAEESEA